MHDNLGGYVLDALDTEDHLLFERHLKHCASCQDEAGGLREVVASLGLVADAPAPPPGLRSAVLTAAAATPQLHLDAQTSSADTKSFDDPEWRQHVAAAEAAPSGRGRVRPLPAARSRRPRTVTLLVAAVTVLAIALGGTVTANLRRSSPTATTTPDISLLAAASDARLLPVVLSNGTRASFVVSRSQNKAQLVTALLPAARPGHSYQLWVLRGSQARPDSTFTAGGDVTQTFHGSVNDATGFALTLEPSGGSSTPTQPLLAVATI